MTCPVVILLFLAVVFGVAALAARWEHEHTAVSRAGKARTAGHGSVPHDPAAPPGRLSAEDQRTITWVGYLTDPRMQPPLPEAEDTFWQEGVMPSDAASSNGLHVHGLLPDAVVTGGEAGHPGNDGRLAGSGGDRVPALTVPPIAFPTPPDDYERWPWLKPGEGYSDETGSFAAICGDAPEGVRLTNVKAG